MGIGIIEYMSNYSYFIREMFYVKVCSVNKVVIFRQYFDILTTQ